MGRHFDTKLTKIIAVVINSLALKWQCLKLNLIGLSNLARAWLSFVVSQWGTLHSHENTVQRDLYFKARKLCSDIIQQKLKMGSALSSYKSKRRDKKEYKRWVNISPPLGGKYSDALATRFCFPGDIDHIVYLVKICILFSRRVGN